MTGEMFDERKEGLPPRFHEQSELTADVSAERTTFDFDLKSAMDKPGNVLPQQPEITNSIGMKLVLIPAGKFTMGSPNDEQGRDDDEEQHAQ
jgi:formylglycine-generating enzyme required for sulfatase activity